jgi:membrane protein YdbS with pleckstrin-like domain
MSESEEQSMAASPGSATEPSEEAGSQKPASATKGLPVFCSLDARVLRMWRIQNLIFTGSLVLAALVGGGLLMILSDAPRFIVPAAILAACALMALLAGWLPPHLYSAYRYRMNDVSLELCSGIFWRKSVLIPVSRVQHVDLQRGPLERRFGLATLQVHTAGTQHATHEIPGLDAQVALHLREQLATIADLVIE